MTRFIRIFLLLLVVNATYAQDGYVSPMPDYPMILSANFAEARPSHLHSGIDIKTGGTIGRRVVAVKDGYVSRIAVKPYGYGRVVYLTHKDGTESVYAHLSSFTPALEQYVKKMRYQTKTNNVDLFPDKNLFSFKKGEQIAKSGNSGSSGGPHLHFEIRNSSTQKPINVVQRGIYDFQDNIPPTIVALHFFAVDTIDGVPFDKKTATFTPVKLPDGSYGFQSPIKINRKGFFALEVTDRKNETSNTMGVYDILETVDDIPVYELRLDDFSFAETKMINSITIYPMQKSSRNEIFRLAKNQNCNFSGVKIFNNNAIIDPSLSKHVEIEVTDDNANVSVLEFDVQDGSDGTESSIFSKPENSYKVESGIDKTVSFGEMTAEFSAKSLFEPEFIVVDSIRTDKKFLSKVYRMAEESLPFFSPVKLSIDYDGEKGKGIVMARYNPSTGKVSSAGGKLVGSRVTANVSTGGYFTLTQDTIPPQITPVFPKGFAWASSKSVSFKISDNFSGVASYSLQVDGHFAILEHVMKQATLIHFFDDEKFGKGKQHKLILTISDGAGNRKVYTKTYTR